MCGMRTAIRRRKQMAKGDRHMAPLKRSRFKAVIITKPTKTKGRGK